MKPNEMDGDKLVERLGEYILKNHSEMHLSEMTRRVIEDFNRTVEKAEKEQDAQTIAQLLYDVMGPRSYMIGVARG